ncbi:MAG: oligosaccharide flippase family protein [Candidatus Omnitrophota bacterium]
MNQLRNRLRIIKDVLYCSASAFASQAIGLVAGFWVARLLGPHDYGIWNAVSLVLTYGAYTEFGVLAAMGRDLPLYLGQGNFQKAAAADGAARYTTVYGAIFASMVVLVFSFFSVHSSMMALGLRVMAVVLVLQQVYTYQRIVLRSHNHFKELGQQQVLFAIASAGLAVLFVVFSGLKGRLIAAILAQAVIIMYALYRNPWHPVPKFNLPFSWSLVCVGTPIILSGLIITMLTSVDRLMAITFLGETQLGYFGLTLLLVSVISLVPAMASQVLYPRINYHFGNTGKNIEALRSYILIPPMVLSSLLPLLIGPLYLILPFVVKTFLPAYTPGIVAARIVVVGIFFYGILGLTDYFLVTTGKLKQYALFGGIALVINIILDFLFIRMGYGIVGIAVGGTLLTYFFYSCIVIGYALSHYTKRCKDWIRFFTQLWIPFVYMLILLWSVERIVDYFAFFYTYTDPLVNASLKVILYLLGCLPLMYIVGRELKLDFSQASLARFGIMR